MPRNASQIKDIRRMEKLSNEAHRAHIDFLCAAMSTVPGRAWFYNLLSSCHIFADPFTGDALLEAYSKGERNIGLTIYADLIIHCPDYFILACREATIKETTDDRRSESDDPDSDLFDNPATE